MDDELDGGGAAPLTADYWQRLLKENWLRLQKVLLLRSVLRFLGHTTRRIDCKFILSTVSGACQTFTRPLPPVATAEQDRTCLTAGSTQCPPAALA